MKAKKKRRKLNIKSELPETAHPPPQPEPPTTETPPPQPPKPERRKPKGPIADIQHIISGSLIDLIHHQSDQIITRGIIRQSGYVIPMELMGKPEEMIKFIQEEYTLRIEDQIELQNKKDSRPRSVAVEFELDLEEVGYTEWKQGKTISGKAAIPISQIDLAIELETEAILNEWIASNFKSLARGLHCNGKTESKKGERTINADGVNEIRYKKSSVKVTLNDLIKKYEIKKTE